MLRILLLFCFCVALNSSAKSSKERIRKIREARKRTQDAKRIRTLKEAARKKRLLEAKKREQKALMEEANLCTPTENTTEQIQNPGSLDFLPSYGSMSYWVYRSYEHIKDPQSRKKNFLKSVLALFSKIHISIDPSIHTKAFIETRIERFIPDSINNEFKELFVDKLMKDSDGNMREYRSVFEYLIAIFKLLEGMEVNSNIIYSVKSWLRPKMPSREYTQVIFNIVKEKRAENGGVLDAKSYKAVIKHLFQNMEESRDKNILFMYFVPFVFSQIPQNQFFYQEKTALRYLKHGIEKGRIPPLPPEFRFDGIDTGIVFN